MAMLLNTKPGTFVVLDDPQGMPSSLHVDGMDNQLTPNVVVTEIGLNRGINHQIRHTFSGVLHIHTFGERVGDLSVSGLLLHQNCNNTNQKMAGVSQSIEYFNKNSMLLRDNPITVTLGNQAVRGFLADMSTGVRGDTVPMGTFRLLLKLLPPLVNRRYSQAPVTAPRP